MRYIVSRKIAHVGGPKLILLILIGVLIFRLNLCSFLLLYIRVLIKRFLSIVIANVLLNQWNGRGALPIEFWNKLLVFLDICIPLVDARCEVFDLLLLSFQKQRVSFVS